MDRRGEEARFNELGPASDPAIDEAISKAYDDANAARQKPPNLVEIVGLVKTILASQGIMATSSQIQKLARADKHRTRRLRPGHRSPKIRVPPT
jgi:hypothetical protein